jgi:hypothetical protein
MSCHDFIHEYETIICFFLNDHIILFFFLLDFQAGDRKKLIFRKI